MGTLHNGLLGGFSGKVGPVVGVTLRNKTILRSLPQPSNKPRSPKQLGNQSSFGLVSSFLAKYRTFINAYFTPDADGKAPMAVRCLTTNCMPPEKKTACITSTTRKYSLAKAPCPVSWAVP